MFQKYCWNNKVASFFFITLDVKKASVTLDRLLFLYWDVPVLKLAIITIINLSTDRREVILPIARTTKNQIVFALVRICFRELLTK